MSPAVPGPEGPTPVEPKRGSGVPRWVFVVVVGGLVGTAGAVALHRSLPAAPLPPPGTSEPVQTRGVDIPDSGPEDASTDGADDGGIPVDDEEPKTLAEQRERLYTVMMKSGGVSPEAIAKLRAIVEASPYIGQGNPDVSVHAMTRAECRKRRAEAKLAADEPQLCGGPNMVPFFDPGAGETKETAKGCIDQYEFPDIPCEYPVVNVRANEADAMCRAVGKRLCDAHEWEGSCAGAVHAPETEYLFGQDRRYSSGMHNLKREILWAYGPKKNYSLCATNSFKTKDCPGGGWKQCGSNTYPTGAFPECRSPFGVYDQHGNAAEHMNLPTKPEERMSAGTVGGLTEMKGSWFIFSKGEAHLDDCRWREPSWHESKVNDPNSHRNYHLGFRCCKDR